MHGGVVGRQLQSERQELPVDGAPRAHDDVVEPRLLLEPLQQLLQARPVERQVLRLLVRPHLPVAVPDLVVHRSPLHLVQRHRGRLRRLQ